jgi:hypothetical protein
MTTSPVAMPMRTCSGWPLTGAALTAAATARPALTANALSAPYSCQLEIQGNPIAIYIDYHGDTLRPKVDTYSISGGADLGENTRDILRDLLDEIRGPLAVLGFQHHQGNQSSARFELGTSRHRLLQRSSFTQNSVSSLV